MSVYRKMLAANFDPLSGEFGDQLLPTDVGSRYRKRDEEDGVAANYAERAARVDPEKPGGVAWGKFMITQAWMQGEIPDYSRVITRTHAIAATADREKAAMADTLDGIRNL